ncbi:MAG: NTP transferase domain-containing protein [Deltaproteobacteria bacterium]|nr:NTP transferase domain-containing protein [Deltaproteobacteria bacterium]
MPGYKALILAAGLGRRLRPITHRRPKALMPVCNVPCLDLLAMHLKAAGVRSLAINVHHLPNLIERHVDGGRHYGMPVRISREEHILGIGGAIGKLRDFWDDAPFLVVNGDLVETLDLSAALKHHQERGNIATMILHDHPRFNNVWVDAFDRVIGVGEMMASESLKPVQRLAFTGVHVISPEILRFLPRNGYSDILEVYLNLAAKGAVIGGFMAKGHYWRDLGTVEDYRDVHADLYRGTAPPELILQECSWPFVHPEARVDQKAELRGWSCVGAESIVGPGCTLENTLVLGNAVIEPGLSMREAVVADGAIVRESAVGGVII